MRLLSTIVLLALVSLKSSACLVVSASQVYNITDAQTKLPVSNAVLTVLYENKVLRTYKSDSLGFIRGWIYGDSKYDVVIKHDDYPKFETSIKLNQEYHMQFIINISKKGTVKIKSNLLEKLYRQSIVRTPIPTINNQVSIQIGNDANFNKIGCKLIHADRAYETSIYGKDKLFNELLLYPNPVNSGEYINLECKYGEKKKVFISNLSGQLVLHEEIIFHQSISTAGLMPGLYVVKIIDEKNDDVVFSKLIIR